MYQKNPIPNRLLQNQYFDLTINIYFPRFLCHFCIFPLDKYIDTTDTDLLSDVNPNLNHPEGGGDRFKKNWKIKSTVSWHTSKGGGSWPVRITLWFIGNSDLRQWQVPNPAIFLTKIGRAWLVITHANRHLKGTMSLLLSTLLQNCIEIGKETKYLA